MVDLLLHFSATLGAAASAVATLLIAAAALLFASAFAWAALTPFETLGWWAGWCGNDMQPNAVPGSNKIERKAGPISSYVLFLSGIGSASSQTMSFRERNFLAHLAERLPQSVLLDEIFPFSANNVSLTAHPLFAPFWHWALNCKRHGPRIFGKLINLRNIFQICTSIDARYGPIYNRGVARVVLRLLLQHDYPVAAGTPVVLVASSGAAQIALGAVPFLKEQLRGPIYVITLGGVFGSDPGLLAVDHFYHIYGTQDRTVPWGWLDSRRWPVRRASAWNRALRRGRVTRVPLAGVHHNGPRGYLDFRHPLPHNRPQLEQTATLVADLIHRHAPAK